MRCVELKLKKGPVRVVRAGCAWAFPAEVNTHISHCSRVHPELNADVANAREVRTHELSRVALHTARLLPGTPPSPRGHARL